MSNSGSESQLTATNRNGLNSTTCSNDEKVAAIGLTLVRESFPVNQPESDVAAKLRLELLADLVREVGAERFMAAVRQTITISKSRWECTVARVREMAGLRYVAQPSPAALAWETVTRVFIDHCRPDENGRYRLEEKVVLVDGKAHVIPVPEIPASVLRAVQGLGGWGGLAEAWPTFWQMKLKDFRDLYHEDNSSLCVDLRPVSDLEKVK